MPILQPLFLKKLSSLMARGGVLPGTRSRGGAISEGNYGQTGMMLRLTVSGIVTVAGIVPHGAADRSGLISLHDTLIAIDGVPVKNMELQQVTHMLPGPVVSEVRVTLTKGASKNRRHSKSDEVING